MFNPGSPDTIRKWQVSRERRTGNIRLRLAMNSIGQYATKYEACLGDRTNQSRTRA